MTATPDEHWLYLDVRRRVKLVITYNSFLIWSQINITNKKIGAFHRRNACLSFLSSFVSFSHIEFPIKFLLMRVHCGIEAQFRYLVGGRSVSLIQNRYQHAIDFDQQRPHAFWRTQLEGPNLEVPFLRVPPQFICGKPARSRIFSEPRYFSGLRLVPSEMACPQTRSTISISAFFL